MTPELIMYFLFEGLQSAFILIACVLSAKKPKVTIKGIVTEINELQLKNK